MICGKLVQAVDKGMDEVSSQRDGSAEPLPLLFVLSGNSFIWSSISSAKCLPL